MKLFIKHVLMPRAAGKHRHVHVSTNAQTKLSKGAGRSSNGSRCYRTKGYKEA